MVKLGKCISVEVTFYLEWDRDQHIFNFHFSLEYIPSVTAFGNRSLDNRELVTYIGANQSDATIIACIKYLRVGYKADGHI